MTFLEVARVSMIFISTTTTTSVPQPCARKITVSETLWRRPSLGVVPRFAGVLTHLLPNLDRCPTSPHRVFLRDSTYLPSRIEVWVPSAPRAPDISRNFESLVSCPGQRPRLSTQPITSPTRILSRPLLQTSINPFHSLAGRSGSRQISKKTPAPMLNFNALFLGRHRSFTTGQRQHMELCVPTNVAIQIVIIKVTTVLIQPSQH